MKPVFFWNTWGSPYKNLYKFLLLMLGAAILFYGIAYFAGSSFIIHWETQNQISPVKMTYDSYRVGLFEFPITIDNYVIAQQFFASDLQVNAWPSCLLLLWMGFFISMVMALIPQLGRFWFILSLGLVALFFAGLRLDFLLMFTAYSRAGLIAALVLYLVPLYIFHFVRKNVSFSKRLITFLAVTIVFALLIHQFARAPMPFLHLTNYGIFVPLLLTVLFVFMTGHEIISGVLKVVSSGGGINKNSLMHFLIISLLFMANVVLVLLRNTRVFDSGFYLIGAFLLLPVTAVIGIWGYRDREEAYHGIYPFFPVGALLYAGLAITAHLTVAWFFITGNDSLAETVEDAVIYSQIGFGAMFFLYAIINFYDLLRNDVNVIKVMYKPARMPYFTSRFAGIVVVMALFFVFNRVPYYQAIAGYYTGIADLYLETGDVLSAAEYYKLAGIYSKTGHRTNYAMATLEKKSGNKIEELNYLKKAISKNPTEYAYANLAALYADEQQHFKALFTLQEGIKKFPRSGQLVNNLGLIYSEIDNVDSAYYWFQAAMNSGDARDAATANIFALLRKKEMSIKEDTLHYLTSEISYLPAVSNLVALANELKVRIDDRGEVKFGKPEKEKIEQIVYNYNKMLNDASLVDSVLVGEMHVFYDSGNVSWFEDQIYFSGAMAMYNQGNVAGSFRELNRLAVLNKEKQYYPVLGKLSMAEDAYALARENFTKAFQNGHPEVAVELAFAYLESAQKDKAEFLWRQIARTGSDNEKKLADAMLSAFEAQSIEPFYLKDDLMKYTFVLCRYDEIDPVELEKLAGQIKDNDMKLMGYLRLAEIYTDLGNKEDALRMLEKIGAMDFSIEGLLEEINFLQCRFAYRFNDPQLMKNIAEGMQSKDHRVKNFIRLFTVLANDESMKVHEKMTVFESLGYKDPLFDPGVLEAARFFDREMNDEEKAYDILLRAVDFNPYSIEINKAYALQCLKLGLRNYALETLEELKTMMPSRMYATFKREFDEAMALSEQNELNWEQ